VVTVTAISTVSMPFSALYSSSRARASSGSYSGTPVSPTLDHDLLVDARSEGTPHAHVEQVRLRVPDVEQPVAGLAVGGGLPLHDPVGAPQVVDDVARRGVHGVDVAVEEGVLASLAVGDHPELDAVEVRQSLVSPPVVVVPRGHEGASRLVGLEHERSRADRTAFERGVLGGGGQPGG
jgi:hypothetical protein